MRLWVGLVVSLWTVGMGAGWDICGISGCFCDGSRDSVDCGGLFFETIPRLPPWLRHFRISGGHITALGAEAFRGAPDLATLTITHSDLAFIHNRALGGLHALTSVSLAFNNLASLPPLLLRDSRRLTDIDLAGNPITDLAIILAALPHRSKFRLHRLDLSAVPFKLARHGDRLPDTEALFLSSTPLTLVNKSGALLPPSVQCLEESCRFVRADWSSLKELDIHGCNASLSSEFLRQLSNASRISIGGNRCQSPKHLDALYGYKQAIALNVSSLLIESEGGRIPSWDIFPPSLQVLDMSHLGIGHLDLDFVPADNSLSQLYARDNEVLELSIPSQMHQLELLDLSGNRLTRLPRLSGWSVAGGIEHLDLSRNRIPYLTEGSLKPFPGLRVLLLRDNVIHTVAASAFPTLGLSTLRELDLSGNTLLSLPSLLLPSLRSLDLSRNNLRELDSDFFLAMPDLTSLNLSHNRQLLPLSTHCSALNLDPGPACFPRFLGHLASLVFLASLDLSATGLSNIPANLLSSLRLLNVLQLNGNQLTGDVWDRWQKTGNLPPCLVVLGLEENLFTAMGNTSFATHPSSCLERLSLARNPFECDCRLAPLRRLFHPGREERVLIPEAEAVDASVYYCERPGSRESLSSFLATVRGCGEEQGRDRVVGLSLAVAFFLCSILVLGLVWKAGAACGRRLSHNINYLYRPLSTMPSNLSSPVHL